MVRKSVHLFGKDQKVYTSTIGKSPWFTHFDDSDGLRRGNIEEKTTGL